MAGFLADSLTIIRFVLAGVMVGLGVVYGQAAIIPAVILAMVAWFTDNLDGFLSRSDPQHVPSWIGRHEFAADVLFTWASLLYFTLSGFIPGWLTAGFTVLAAAVSLWFRRKPVVVLFLRIIDVTLAVVLFYYYPTLGVIVAIYLVTLAIVKWQRLAQGVPAWARSLRDILRGKGE